MTHHVEVLLTILSRSPKDLSQTVVLLRKTKQERYSLPTAPLGESESTFEVAANILCSATGAKARVAGSGWVDLVQCPIADNNDRMVDGHRTIGVPWIAMMPSCSPCGEHEWVPVHEAINADLVHDHKEVLAASLNHL